MFDGELSSLADRFTSHKTIKVTCKDHVNDLNIYGEVMRRTGDRFTLSVPKSETSRVTARLLADLSISDLTVEDPPIEDVIERIFAQGSAE